MDEYVNRYLYFLRHVKFIWDKKTKIQHLLSELPQGYKDQVKFVEPQTLYKAIQNTKNCYE